MNSLKKSIKYKLYIYIKCPYCLEKESKDIYIALPLRTLPNTINCFNCGVTFEVKNILKGGTEEVEKQKTITGHIK